MPAFWTRLGAGVAVCAVIGAAAAVSPYGAPRIQSTLQAEVAARLAASDIPWAEAHANGRAVALSGTAPDARSLKEAVRMAASLPGVARVDASALVVAPPIAEPPPRREAAPPEPPPAVEAANPAVCQSSINRTLNGRHLTFRNNSAWLSQSDRALLDDVAAALASCASLTIVIEGHTDATGSEAANLRLSEKRAKSVEGHFQKFELPVALVSRAYGESRPIASNRSAEGRAANRRIDFVVETAAPESPMESE